MADEQPRYVSQVMELLRSLDASIADRTEALKRTYQITGEGPTKNLRSWGPAEGLAAYTGAKARVLEVFPEVKSLYEGSLEKKVTEENPEKKE